MAMLTYNLTISECSTPVGVIEGFTILFHQG